MFIYYLPAQWSTQLWHRSHRHLDRTTSSLAPAQLEHKIDHLSHSFSGPSDMAGNYNQWQLARLRVLLPQWRTIIGIYTIIYTIYIFIYSVLTESTSCEVNLI